MFGVIRRFYVSVDALDKSSCTSAEFQTSPTNHGYHENYCVSLFNNDPLENHKPGAVRKLYIISFFESDGKQDK